MTDDRGDDLSYSDLRPAGEAADAYDRLKDFRDPVATVVRAAPPPPPPAHDRVRVHLLWEAVLLVGAAVVALLAARRHPGVLAGDGLPPVLVAVAAVALLALAADLSLRAGAVNLAVGPVAVAAGLHLAEQGDRGAMLAAAWAVGAAAAVGLVAGLVLAALAVPGWAVTLAAGAAAAWFVALRAAPVAPQGAYRAVTHAAPLAAAALLAALVVGVVGAAAGTRRLLGRCRPAADPAARRGPLAGAVGAAALAGSMAAAAGGGLLLAASGDPVSPDPGLRWTALAVGAALLGGVSGYGRRGAVAGTALAAAAVVAAALFVGGPGVLATLTGPRGYLVAGGALLAGLLVTRLVERRSGGRGPAPG